LAGNLWQRGSCVGFVSGPVDALVDECHRLSENCAYTATNFTIWLRWLRGIRMFFQVSPVVFGALATWKIVAQTSPTWGAVFALLATAIPPAYRASKTDEAIAEYTTAAGEFTNLRDRFRQAALISSHKPFPEFDADTKPLIERLEKAHARTLTPPEWFFVLARRKHKSGHYTHDHDEQKQVSLRVPSQFQK
jgi:hypothetical protein